MRLLLLMLSGFLISAFSYADEVQVSTPSPNYKACVHVSQPSRSSYTFYNTCGERLFFKVCATDFFGEKKLYDSGRSIQVNGRYTIYLVDSAPQAIAWAAGPTPPAAPPGCADKKKV